jgi:hypothetical protein
MVERRKLGGNMIRLAIVIACVVLATVIAACSAPPPPILGDQDSGGPGDVYVPPCSVPAQGCPCEEAGVQETCGTVYHYAGSYVTCAEEYITCQEDNTWGPCAGPLVFGAD